MRGEYGSIARLNTLVSSYQPFTKTQKCIHRVSIYLHNASSSLEEQQQQKHFKIPNVQSLLRTTVPSLGEKSLFLPKI